MITAPAEEVLERLLERVGGCARKTRANDLKAHFCTPYLQRSTSFPLESLATSFSNFCGEIGKYFIWHILPTTCKG
jgi:hypothetical protein